MGAKALPLDGSPRSGWKNLTHNFPDVDELKVAKVKKAVEEFEGEFGTKWPKAAARISEEKEALLAYYDYPAEHRRRLRTTNPIESPFATVRARTDLTKGPGSREVGMAMVFQLLEAAEERWRRLNGYRLVSLVRAGARFVNGELVERSEKGAA